MSEIVTRRGAGALVLSFPHVSTHLPAEVAETIAEAGRAVADTDWHVDRLYDGIADELDATVLKAPCSRYVIDLNRDPSGTSLYPGQVTTGLCPTTTFDGDPIYSTGHEPGPDEIARRVAAWFEPYHAALDEALARAKDAHGFAFLWDGHSIRSAVPRLFQGVLPELSFGTWEGRSCGPDLRQTAAIVGKTSQPYDYVLDGRFKGGWITRHYGRPAENVFAIQLELAQRAYLAEEGPPWRFDEAKAQALRPVLRRAVVDLLGTARRLARRSAEPCR